MMITNLKVILRPIKRKGEAKNSKYIRMGAFAVQDTADGPVEGTDLLRELSPVSSKRDAKALVLQLLENAVKNVEFV